MPRPAKTVVSNKVKATIVECKNYKSGSLMICELEDGTETAVFVNVPDFTPFSRSIELTQDGDYYRYRQVVTMDDKMNLASKYGIILKA